MTAADIEYCYEGSDEASENELLDQSLSLWNGWSGLRDEEFAPIPLDLHTAASIGQYNCVRNIIQRHEEDIDRKNTGGWTPLMYACYIGHDTVVNLFLETDVNLNAKNNKGQTPLMLAACCGNESVAYFLLQAGAELESRDKKGWTALFHATYSGHQNMVRFLLEAGANAESKEPRQMYTPFMEAAAAGHEIIVQCFLQHGVKVNAKAYSGDTARTLALMNGHIKIVSLIENHLAGPSLRLRSDPGLNFDADLSSSDEQYQYPRRPNSRPRTRSRGPSIREGPEALTKLIDQSRVNQHSHSTGSLPITDVQLSSGQDRSSPDLAPEIRDRDVTSPINHRDLDSSGGRDSLESAEYEEDVTAFSRTGALTIKSGSSCSSSSGGLAAALGLSRNNSLDEGSSESDPQRPPRPSSDPGQRSTSGYLDDTKMSVKFEEPKVNPPTKEFSLFPETNTQPFCLFPSGDPPIHPQQQSPPQRPPDLPTLLNDLGLNRYRQVFEDQDVDLQVFLSLTDSDLKEIGIKLFGPRRKMTNAIARWHSDTWSVTDPLEKVYADRLEAEMQEMAIQLHQAYEQSEQLKQQVLQEQELRSVTESCLMEERRAWQHVQRLAADTRQRCLHVQQTLRHIRLFQEELCRRLGADPQPSLSGSSDSLTMALKERLSLDDNNVVDWSNIPELGRFTIQDIMRKLIKCREELCGSAALTLLNSDKLLGREIEFPPKYS